MLDRLRSGGVDGLIVMGHDVLDAAYLGGVELLAKLDTLIVLDTHHSALERVAHVLLPVRVAAEKHGTLTNHAGRVQSVRARRRARLGGARRRRGAHAPRPGARAPGLARALGRARGVARARGRAPAFAGRDLDSVGADGAPLAEARA